MKVDRDARLHTIESSTLAVLRKRGWQLVAPQLDAGEWKDFLATVAAYMEESTGSTRTQADRVERAVLGAYCRVLHAACSDAGSARQHQAFTELWDWVYRRAIGRTDSAKDAEDVTQNVLEAVYLNLERVTEPHGFLGFVSIIIHRRLAAYYHQKRRDSERKVPLEHGMDVPDEISGDPLEITLYHSEQEMTAAKAEIIRLLDECMPSKSAGRKFVLVQLMLCRRSVAELMEQLQCSANAVYLLIHHGRADLRKHCPELMRRLFEVLSPSERQKYENGEAG